MKSLIISLLLFVCIVNSGKTQDRYFATMYGSSTLKSGQKELEVWNLLKHGRHSYYQKLEEKLEFEVGLSSRLQTSFYVNFSQVKSFNKTLQKIESATPKLSFANAWKFNVLNPGLSKWGLGLYGEYTISPGEFELEAKILADRFFGKNYFSTNLVIEPEWELELEANGELEYETEWEAELDLGYMRFFNKTGLGLETKVHNKYHDQKWSHSALFLGPTLNYAGNNWWVLINILPQIAKLKSIYPEDRKIVLSEQEKWNINLIFSYTI